MSFPGIRLENVTVAYDRHPAVHHVSGQFEPGSLTAIVGPNGAGKSTLLKAMMGELARTEGRIDLGGLSPRDFGYLPQAADIDRRFPPSLAEKARQALTAVGLEGFERRAIGSLSAGQFQRVLFARLLLQDARVIVLDEPFTAIDARTTRDLLEIVRRWHDNGRTVIAVLHDFEQVRAHFPTTLLLARRAIAWGATDEALSPDNLRRARAMAEDWDEDAMVCKEDVA